MPARLRGRSSPAPTVQAAQHHARITTGATGLDDRRGTDVTSDGAPAGSTGWRATFTRPDCVVQMPERSVSLDQPSTCAARPAGRIRVFDLADPHR
ncbi:hypothetical protein [Pseudonocardia alni]|uniref:hypothetical protein n=1 Tax=Pseudonocardia alni TaxID=33907 RepID=UPI0033CC7DE6